MAIRWKVIKRKNPKSEQTAYYATNAPRSRVTFNSLAQEIEKLTSLTAGDALNMLRTMQYLVIQHLQNSDTVNFDQLGTFWSTIKSSATDTKEKVTASNIKSCTVRFIPGSGLRAGMKLDNISFEKVDETSAADSTGA